MLQPYPTLPIPGQENNSNYSLNIGFGGTINTTFVCDGNTNRNEFVFSTIDFSNLIATYSDSTIKQGYTVVTSTMYVDNTTVLIQSDNIDINKGPNGDTYNTYNAYPCYGVNPINTNILYAFCFISDTFSCTATYQIIIRLMTFQYEYPTLFTERELFEDLKTLPEVGIRELKKLDCEKMQGALGLLETFNVAKLAS